MNRRIAIKILRRAGENLAGLNWPRETYCPPFRLIDRAAVRLLDDGEHAHAAEAWAGSANDPRLKSIADGHWLDGLTNEEGAWL